MATIQLQTAIPGPKSKALAERRDDAIPRGLSIGTPVYVAKAEDAWLEDVDGNRYLDFAGGIGCLNVGHRREPVVTAVKNAARSLSAHLRSGDALRRATSVSPNG